MSEDGLPPLRDIINRHELRADKKFGQNFILDLNVTRRIARQARDLTACDVVEIGPGPGGLTRGLLMEGARKVHVIEADSRFIPALEEIAAAYPGRLNIIEGDVLSIPPDSLTAAPYRIVSNLPYNIGTVLLTDWLDAGWQDGAWSPRFLSMTLMFQKEVANRIIAKKKSKTYGRLSIISQYMYECAVSFDLKAKCFYPAPKVDSSVVTFNYLNSSLKPNIEVVQEITRLAFGQRRKKIKSSLKNIISEENLIKKYKLNPDLRPEDLSVEDYIKLSYLYEKG